MINLSTKIISKPIIFRKIKLSDAKIIQKQVNIMHILNKEKIIETLSFVKKDIKKAQNNWKKKKSFEYVIEYKNKISGTILLTFNNKYNYCELGYYIDPKYWGKGLIYKILNSVIEYIFTETNYEKIRFRCRSDNIKSCKSLNKFGAKKEAIIKGYFYENKKLIDAYYYQILKSNWKK